MTRQVILAFLAGALIAGMTGPLQAQTDLEEQVRAVAAELRCPVCQNLSVADSPSEMAQQMRAVIRERLQAGQSPEAVIAYFTEKYGEWILLSPKPRGFNLLVWLLPGAATLAGLVGVGWTARRWLRSVRAVPEAVRDEDDPYVRRVREELESFGESIGRSPSGSASVKQQTSPPRSVARPATRRRPLIVATWTGGVLAFGVILGVLLVRSLEPRMEGMSITGGVGGMPGMPMAPASAGVDDLKSRLAEAHSHVEQQRFAEALPIYQRILEQDPHNVEALTHLAIAQAGTGQLEASLATFDRALAMDPNNYHALWNKAQVLSDVKLDYAAAIPLWERIATIARESPDAATARRYLEQARQKLGAREGSQERR